MAGGFWRANSNDLRGNLNTGRMDFSYGVGGGGQNMMNRGYTNGMGSNAAMGMLKGMASQRSDLGQRNDRAQYQTGLDSYGRAGLEPYYAMGRSLVDTYRDPYADNSHSFNPLSYMSRDSYMDPLQQSGMAQYAATDRNMYSNGSQQRGQGGQFGPSSPQVAGRKRAAGWDSGRGGSIQNLQNSRGSNNRSKKAKGAQPTVMSSNNTRVKSISANAPDQPRDTSGSDLIKALYCIVCDMRNFSSVEDFRSHLSGKPHSEIIESIKLRNQANLEYLRLEAKIAAKKNMMESRRKGLNVTGLKHCPICKCEYYGSYSAHKLAFEHEQISKFDQPKCCGKTLQNHNDYIEHQLTVEHIQNKCGEESNKSSVTGKLEDLLDGNVYSIGVKTIEPYQPHKPFGMQVLSEHPGYMCQLCLPRQDFNISEIREHCASLSHYKKVVEALANKSDKSEASLKKIMRLKMKLNDKASNEPVDEKDKTKRIVVEDADEEIEISNVGERIDQDGDEIDEDALDYEYV